MSTSGMSAWSVEYATDSSDKTATFGQSTDSELHGGTPSRAMAVRAAPGASQRRSVSAGPSVVSGGTVMTTKIESLPAPPTYGPARNRDTTPPGARSSPVKGKAGASPKSSACLSAAEGSGSTRALTPLRHHKRDPLFAAAQQKSTSKKHIL